MADPLQPTPRFLQKLDTVDYEPKEADRIGAEIHLGLMLGQSMVLSQTQAFDSGHFLRFAESADFRSLLHRGHVQVCLLQEPATARPLCTLLAAKAKNHNFHLSGWPEIPEVLPETASDPERKAKIELRNEIALILEELAQNPVAAKAHLGRLPASLAARWHTLRDVDGVLAQKMLHMTVKSPPRPLTEWLHQAADAYVANSVQKRFLRKVAGLVEKGDRSHYREKIQHDASLTKQEKQEASEFVNLEYNRVVADSLNADGNLFTTFAELRSVEGDDSTQQVVKRLANDPSKIAGITWESMLKIMEILNGDAKPEAKARALEELNVIAVEEMVEHRPGLLLKLAPRVGGFADEVVVADKAWSLAGAVFGFEYPDYMPPISPGVLQIFKNLTGFDLSLEGNFERWGRKVRDQQQRQLIMSLEQRHPKFPKAG